MPLAAGLHTSSGTFTPLTMSETTAAGGGRPDPVHERDLVRRAQDGDSEALEEVLALHQNMIYRTSLRLMAGNEEEAGELAQQVLISAFRHIGKFRSESRFSTWLYRITTNLAKNRYVVQNRERARFSSLDAPAFPGEEDDAPARDWADGAISADRTAAGREMIAIVHERLEGLEPEWREIIVLRFFEELSYEEIAETLGLPLGTVKSRINRARRALRAAMQDVLEGEDVS